MLNLIDQLRMRFVFYSFKFLKFIHRAPDARAILPIQFLLIRKMHDFLGQRSGRRCRMLSAAGSAASCVIPVSLAKG
jgi:hypothetical protein